MNNEPMSDERLAEIRESWRGNPDDQFETWDQEDMREVQDLLAEVDRLRATLSLVTDLVMDHDGGWLAGEDFDGLAGAIQEVVVPLRLRAIEGEPTEAMRCPGCDADPNAPHNGNGDCRNQHTEGGPMHEFASADEAIAWLQADDQHTEGDERGCISEGDSK